MYVRMHVCTIHDQITAGLYTIVGPLKALLQCKEEVMARFSLPTDEVEISMGMSNDFEQAVSSIPNYLLEIHVCARVYIFSVPIPCCK